MKVSGCLPRSTLRETASSICLLSMVPRVPSCSAPPPPVARPAFAQPPVPPISSQVRSPPQCSGATSPPTARTTMHRLTLAARTPASDGPTSVTRMLHRPLGQGCCSSTRCELIVPHHLPQDEHVSPQYLPTISPRTSSYLATISLTSRVRLLSPCQFDDTEELLEDANPFASPAATVPDPQLKSSQQCLPQAIKPSTTAASGDGGASQCAAHPGCAGLGLSGAKPCWNLRSPQ